MRQVVLDTETTGLGADHRIIEIGCIELVDRKLTDQHFHTYLNPERLVDPGAFKVHGISHGFLQDKPLFKDIMDPFLAFVDGAELIIHNAPFDMGFLNAELQRARWPKPLNDHCRVFDTLALAKQKHPGQRNNLDALCKRYDVNNSNRQLHGALLDAEILAWVYLAMTGGQISLFDEDTCVLTKNKTTDGVVKPLSAQSPVQRATPEESAQHDDFVRFLIDQSGKDLWS